MTDDLNETKHEITSWESMPVGDYYLIFLSTDKNLGKGRFIRVWTARLLSKQTNK